jgi:DNA invertase Pin-like site-specific DNA recombinase
VLPTAITKKQGVKNPAAPAIWSFSIGYIKPLENQTVGQAAVRKAPALTAFSRRQKWAIFDVDLRRAGKRIADPFRADRRILWVGSSEPIPECLSRVGLELLTPILTSSLRLLRRDGPRMLVGYARTSTMDQVAGIEAQLTELKAAGCEKVFREQVSSVGKRGELEAAIEFCRDGDVFLCTKLDRLARSIADLGGIIARLERKKIALRILNLNLDTSTPTGKLMLNLLGSVAQFEREILLERQREGIAKAKREGKYRGRKPTARAKADQVRKLLKEGTKPADVATQLSISRASVYRLRCVA